MELFEILICVGVAVSEAMGGVLLFLKNKKNKSDATNAKAELAVNAEAVRLVKNNEINLADLHNFLKKELKGTASGQRFENVMNGLKIFCLYNHINYTDEQLENKVVEIVKLTKEVNYEETAKV